MKNITIPTSVLILILSVFAAWALEPSAAGVLKRLAVTEASARESILANFTGRAFHVPGTSLKSIAIGERAGIVRQMGQYTKEYTRTEAFRDAYRAYREGVKPSPPEKAKTMDELRTEQRQQLRKSIQDMEAGMKTVPTNMQDSMREMVAALQKQLKDIDDPNNPMFSKEMADMLRQSGEAEQQAYNDRLIQWEQQYPTKPDRIIAGWLEEFLTVSGDVDFGAKLVPGNSGKMKFANPDYESKPSEWKMCFRAGREAVQATRAFAQAWLAELAQ